ncbi:MAG: discoidin domain-containing protein [Bacteroidaceae bacterium]|nr:discoidin domain-containing protein [Bacteroidaceae bacterium]
MMLFVQLIISGGAFAADPPESEYQAALKAFPSGAYYLTTEIDGVKYYVTASGSVEERTEDLEASDGLFTINQVDASSAGDKLFDVAWHIEGANGHFSNSTLVDSKCLLNPETGVFRLDGSNNRNDWESQVFYLNETGKFAIRSCNTAYGESSWADAGRAFWTFQVDEVGEIVWGDYGPMPAYSYEPAYIWTLEQPTGYDQVKLVIGNIYNKYEDLIWEDPEDPNNWGLFLNMGTEFGQLADWDTYKKLWTMLQEVNAIADKFTDESYKEDYYTDPEACSLEQAERYEADADSMYQVILDSEVPYSLPNGDGYYRIKSILRYYTDNVVGKDEWDEDIIERSYVDKAFLASFENQGMFGTLRPEMANQVWKLTQKGDSILMQNAGMGSYISITETPGSDNRIYLTEDVNDAACVVFDWAGEDEVDTDDLGNGNWVEKETFNIRLASKARHEGNYVHQNGHSTGKDSHKDLALSFWYGTYGKDKYDNDGGTSEWYLESVSEEEVAELIKNFAALKDHDLLVKQNNELREKVLETLTLAKDVQKTPLITDAAQMSSPNSDSVEGTNIGNLLDGDASTFWHTDWHGESAERMVYNDIECHYLQLTGMDNFVGDCEIYLRERAADNDRVKKFALLGTDNLKNEDEDWELIADLTVPHTGSGEESTISLHVDDSYPYIRMLVYDTDGSSYAFRTFWHAAELQFYTVTENPNSQFVLMGEVAQNLQNAYDANIAISDDALTPEDYNALLAAYEAFQAVGLVDPAEMREALAKYAKATEGVVEGTNPGYWSDMTVPNAFNAFYAEVEAYNKAGVYNADQIHKYAVMLKAMQKGILDSANGVKTDKWYRIMYPTEEMFDAYNFSKEGADDCGDLYPEDQKTMYGTIVSTAKLLSEEDTDYDDDGNEVTVTNNWLEAIGGEDLREGDRLFFMNDDAIEDVDASLFRFKEIKSEETDYTPLLLDVKENMGLGLDLCTSFKQGDALITKASQFSSNASYPGNDGQKLETGCLIDNDFATYWHSDYSKKYCEVPYLQVALNEPVSGFIQVYVGRRNTSNGHVVRMYVQGSNDAETWTNVGYIETPFINATTPVTSQPIDLGGTFSHLRFTMTQRSGSDGGSNIEFDPFAENLTADDYNVKFTYFHASEFQIYPVTAEKELTGSAKALLDAYTVANKVVLKDATAEDLAAASKAYTAYQSEFNAAEGKAILPNSAEKAPATYALQNKATGLFVMVSGTGNQNNIYLKAVPTLVGYKAIGYERSLLSAKNTDGVSCNNLHAGESNRRFCTWGSTEPTSNSGLVICEADAAFEIPAEYTFVKDIKPGKIYGLANSVTLTPVGAPEGAVAYTPLGQYTVGEEEEAETFLALKAIETIPAGEPAFYIYGDTTSYDAEDDEDAAPVKFKFSNEEELVKKGEMVNGVLASLVNHTLQPYEIYFTGNYAKCIGESGYYISGPTVAFDVDNCPKVDPEGDYDFSILISAAAADAADGVKDINTAIENISQPGNVYSMDGKLLRTGATLNSLKSLGKGMYILNGVKVVVK